jgi:hypothetical protein
MTIDGVKRRDEQMREKRCYQLCLSCEGCKNFTSNRQACVNCAPEYRQCICGSGVRRFLTTDGFVAIKEFGRHDKTGKYVDRGELVRLRQVVHPPLG